METIVYPLLSLFVGLSVTAFSMPLLLRFCSKRGLFDIPNERKVHHNKIPRLGGVLFAPAIVLGMSAVAVLMILRGDTDLKIGVSAMLLFAALFMIFVIGLIDDILGLKWNTLKLWTA